MTNYPITDTGSIDMLGDEFPSLFYVPKARKASPLMADVAGADVSSWSSEARPPVTAWEGADMDAHWLDNGTWRHCRTGEAWEGEPVNLLDAVNQFRKEAATVPLTLDVVTDFICALVAASSLDSVREGSEQLEAAE